MIDFIVTFTDNNLKNIAKGLLSNRGIEASDLRELKMTKTKVIDSIVADPEFKESLLKTLKTHLSFGNLYDRLPFEDDMYDIAIIQNISDALEVKNKENSKKLMIERARELLIENGYTVTYQDPWCFSFLKEEVSSS